MPFDQTRIPQGDTKIGSKAELEPDLSFLHLGESMDEVAFHNLGRAGKETVLIKHLRNKTVEDYYQACELEPYPGPKDGNAERQKRGSVTVRQILPAEAVEVSKCIYRAYGYSYAYEHLYYPERIAELNQTGQMYSAVAVTEQNEIAGQSAFIFWHDRDAIAEMAQAVVKPEFRGQGILARIAEYPGAKVRC